VTTTSKLSAPATLPAWKMRFKRSAVAGFCTRAVEFGQVYRLYRKAAHSTMQSLRIAARQWR